MVGSWWTRRGDCTGEEEVVARRKEREEAQRKSIIAWVAGVELPTVVVRMW
jgi:hypothetical protein